VDQAHYLRLGEGAPCEVWWGTPSEGTGSPQQPVQLLPPVVAATEAGTETVNEVLSRHYTISKDKPGKNVAGEVWLAENGGYVVRYVLTVSGEEDALGEGVEGEQRFEYNLSQLYSPDEVIYPEGCLPVLMDFPVPEGARNLHRLPNAVDYTVVAETAAISQFYQDQLTAQGWMFVNAHADDPKNVTLVFVHEEHGQAASILLSTRDTGVWVSAILRPRESSSDE
jgi:hypothetical protein